jgi:hypothetical protein
MSGSVYLSRGGSILLSDIALPTKPEFSTPERKSQTQIIHWHYIKFVIFCSVNRLCPEHRLRFIRRPMARLQWSTGSANS